MSKRRNITKLKIDASIFSSCHNLGDLQQKLAIAKNDIVMTAFNVKYHHFNIRKPKGGFRKIEAPDDTLKKIQAKLNYYLQAVYYLNQTNASYGYIITPRNKKSKKNIVQNATKHLGCKYMLKVDFKDFFHQINTKNIASIYNADLFSFNKKTSNLLTRISVYKNRLPMGSPISPVLSNLHTIKLDNTLENWANNNGIMYTRFVDDLTFSSKDVVLTKKHFLAINTICLNHKLKLNETKTVFFNEKDTKLVTGLLLSDTIDIHPDFYNSLEKNITRLKHLFEASVLTNKIENNSLLKKFRQIVSGQLNFIRTVEGHNSDIYKSYKEKYLIAQQVDLDKLSENWLNFTYL